MTIFIGDNAPDFSLMDVNNSTHTLSQHSGRKVMLSFYRSAKCPLCNYAIDELTGRYKKLAWAANLDVIAVFQSATENIDKFILKTRIDGSSKEERRSQFPFVVLSDSEQETYAKYGAEKSVRGFVKGSVNVLRGTTECKKYVRCHYQKCGYHLENFTTRLPSDFLIDEDGIIVDCFHAKAINEHIPLDRIDKFLLGESSRLVERSKSEGPMRNSIGMMAKIKSRRGFKEVKSEGNRSKSEGPMRNSIGMMAKIKSRRGFKEVKSEGNRSKSEGPMRNSIGMMAKIKSRRGFRKVTSEGNLKSRRSLSVSLFNLKKMERSN